MTTICLHIRTSFHTVGALVALVCPSPQRKVAHAVIGFTFAPLGFAMLFLASGDFFGVGEAQAAQTTSAPSEEDNTKFSEQAERATTERAERINAELATLGDEHPWAGSYYQGDGLGVNVSLLIAPKSGYVFEWHGCLGVYDRNYGEITVVDGRLHFSFTFKNERKGFKGIAEEFVPITWDSRHYLVPAEDIPGFCNAVNADREPRDEPHGRYLLREGDEKKKVTGHPSVPAAYQGYLLDKPITATIIAVNGTTTRPSVCDWNFRDTEVTLNAGRTEGLLPGMELHVTKPGNLVESVKIKSLDEHTARAVMTQNEDEKGPRVGWTICTRPRWAGARRHPAVLEPPASQPSTEPESEQRLPTGE